MLHPVAFSSLQAILVEPHFAAIIAAGYLGVCLYCICTSRNKFMPIVSYIISHSERMKYMWIVIFSFSPNFQLNLDQGFDWAISCINMLRFKPLYFSLCWIFVIAVLLECITPLHLTLEHFTGFLPGLLRIRLCPDSNQLWTAAILLPSPCFTIGMVYSGWCAMVIFQLQRGFCM